MMRAARAISSFDELVSRLAAQTVLCVGDLMLDEFVYGEVTRISPEAATPVLAVSRREMQIGGAGNVARNIAGLGAACLLVGVIGADAEGECLAGAFLNAGGIEPHLVVDSQRPTTRKVRFVSERHSTHLLRADWEQAKPLTPAVEDALLQEALALITRAGALVLSDYAKGALTIRVVQMLIQAARRADIPVIVDPKGADYSVYRGATLITPNSKELAEATRLPATTAAEVEAASAALAHAIGAEAVAVTRSEEGISLYMRGRPAVHVPAHPVRVRDVSGAGDTVAALLGVCLAMGADLESAVHAANAAASVVVGKRGTASVSAAELRARLIPLAPRAAQEKIVFDWSLLDETLTEWRRQRLRIGFANGCFDLLHPGHVKLLREARAACDRLIVGLNSDASVGRLKGAGRPIQDQAARAEVLAALEAVDLVVIFDEDTPLALIDRIRPRVLIKGSDYRREQVVGRELVEAEGGEVLLVDIVPGYSTSGLVDQSHKASGARGRDRR